MTGGIKSNICILLVGKDTALSTTTHGLPKRTEDRIKKFPYRKRFGWTAVRKSTCTIPAPEIKTVAPGARTASETVALFGDAESRERYHSLGRQRLEGSILEHGQVAALTKRRRDGGLYERRKDVEEAIALLVNAPRTEISTRLKVRDPSSRLHVQSECIVYLMRAARYDNDERYFNELYRELMRRILTALPKVEGERIDVRENVHALGARDRVRDAFLEKLSKDRAEPGSDLDYFEINFADAIAALRKTSMYRAKRQAARTDSIEADDDTNQPSLAVEQAVGSFDIKEELISEDPIYRCRVATAIQALPDTQRRVIEMILQEIPIDSSDGDAITMKRLLGVKSEKTVRNRRDAAFQALRKALEIGTDDD